MSYSQLIPPDATREQVINGVDCSLVRGLSFEERCAFVKEAKNCQAHGNIINYLEFVYCQIDPREPWEEKMVIPVLFLFLLFCFYILGVMADVRLCPALQILSKVLRMSEVLAGVTLVAFGNCAPDFFSSIFSANDPDRQVYSDILATTMLTTSVIPGLIIVISPFKLHPSSILRDSSFILFGIVMVNFFIGKHGIIKFYQAIIMIILYICYIVIVFVDLHLLRKAVAAEAAERRKNEEVELDMKRRRTTTTLFRVSFIPMVREGKNAHIFKQFAYSFLPFRVSEWKESNLFNKIIIIVKTPIIFIINMTIPNTDNELENSGWSKLLNCIQLITLPIIICFMALPRALNPLYCSVGCTVVTLPLSIFVMVDSRVDTAPKYHWIFAVYAAVGATTAISITANEACELIYALGLIVGVSSSFLGATILAWGNCIGDVVADLMLAYQGFQAMGFAACFGSPIFNLFFTMGFALSLQSFPTGEYEVSKGVFGETCNIFMIIHCVITLIWMTLLDFNARRMIGILCLFMYIFFFTFTILTELHIIDSYNSVPNKALS